MRFRSEWLTLFTMTALAVAGLSWPRADAPAPASAKRGDVTAAGIDDMPVGTARAVDRAKPLRVKPQAVRP